MDQIGEIILRLKINELEVQIALREIELIRLSAVTNISHLHWKIEVPKTDEDERCRLTICRDRTVIEWGKIQELRERHRHELGLTPRGKLN